MNFKKWPYWVRGGVLGLSLSLIAYLLLLLFNEQCIALVGTGIDWKQISYCQILYPIHNFIDYLNLLNLPHLLFTLSHTPFQGEMALMTFGFISEGLLLGWLYGKMKRENNES